MIEGRGFRAAAVLIALVSVLTLPAGLREPLDALGIDFTPLERLDLLAPSLSGFAAAWALWTRRRWAPEGFLGWAIIVLGATLHLSLTLIPRILGVIAEILPELGFPSGMSTTSVVLNLLLNALLLGIGYWQLAKSRPGGDGRAAEAKS